MFIQFPAIRRSLSQRAWFTVLFALSFLVTSCISGLRAQGNTITLIGAGGTFPAPLYQRWFSEYNKIKPNIQVSYQAIGSGAGVEQFTHWNCGFWR